MRLCLASQSQHCEGDTPQTDAEFLQRPTPRDSLGQALRHFIEFFVHNIVLVC
jgi:hypothetical protein